MLNFLAKNIYNKLIINITVCVILKGEGLSCSRIFENLFCNVLFEMLLSHLLVFGLALLYINIRIRFRFHSACMTLNRCRILYEAIDFVCFLKL